MNNFYFKKIAIIALLTIFANVYISNLGFAKGAKNDISKDANIIANESNTLEEKEAKLIKEGMQKLLNDATLIVKSNIALDAKTSEISKLFDDYLDIKHIGFFALGKYKKDFSKDQKQQYLELFKKYILNFTSKGLQAYNSQLVEINNVSYNAKLKVYSVQTKVTDADKKNTFIEYHAKFNNKQNNYKIINIISKGQDNMEIDLKGTLRTLFTSAMSSDNNNYFEQLKVFLGASNSSEINKK